MDRKIKTLMIIIITMMLTGIGPLSLEAEGIGVPGGIPLRWWQEGPHEIRISLIPDRLQISEQTAIILAGRLLRDLAGIEPEETVGRSELLTSKEQARLFLQTLEKMEVTAALGIRLEPKEDSGNPLLEETDRGMPLGEWLASLPGGADDQAHELWTLMEEHDLVLMKIAASEDETREMNIVTEPVDSYRILVNRQWELPATYVPADLVIPNVPSVFSGDIEARYLRAEAAEALEALYDAALEETGKTLYLRSGYRSYETQRVLFNSRARERGVHRANLSTAQPGQSEHQTGLAVDITSDTVNRQLSQRFADTSEGKWIEAQASQFGFIIRYPAGKEAITGYIYEPWHLRYVGIPLATRLSESGLTMEEFADQLAEGEAAHAGF